MKLLSPEEIVIRLKKLIKRIEHFDWEFKDIGITRSQIRIIFPIIKDGCGYSMHELSELTGVDKALVSRTIADLEGKGYVERCKKTENERNYKIILSEKGREFCEVQRAKVKELSGKWLNGVTKDEFFQFFNVLDRLTEQKE